MIGRGAAQPGIEDGQIDRRGAVGLGQFRGQARGIPQIENLGAHIRAARAALGGDLCQARDIASP
jgi:hypothetical protein